MEKRIREKKMKIIDEGLCAWKMNKALEMYRSHIFIRHKVEKISMYRTESFLKVLVPKYYKSTDALIEDAFRALLNLKPELKVEMAIELYLKGEISLLRASEIAGMDIESFKEMLKARGLKVSSYIGSKEEIEKGLRLISDTI